MVMSAFAAQRILTGFAFGLVFGLMASPLRAESKADSEVSYELGQFIGRYCLDCHNDKKAKGKLNLSGYQAFEAFYSDPLLWEKVANRVSEYEMPPDDEDILVPEQVERIGFVETIRAHLHQSACGDGTTPGPAIFRRLNRAEYSASVRELLDIHFDAGEALPDEGAGGEGFDNAAETLFISPVHAERYLDAARSSVTYAFADTRSNRRFLIAKPDEDVSEDEAAWKVLEALLPRAFRRAVEWPELLDFFGVYARFRETGEGYDQSLQAATEAVLMSPNFLFLVETPNEAEEPVLVTDYEIASRLSYFLWGGPPDAELMQLAGQGRLNREDELKRQVVRMVKDENSRKVREFAGQFVEQWLGTRALGREFKPDAAVGDFDAELEGGMKYEPVFFFHEVLSSNRPVLDLISADYTYANRRLARHYGIEGSFREQPKRVALTAESPRGGLLGMSAVLAVSSYPHRTSPVLRGAWILDKLLGDPPPPPPPDVPELEEVAAEGEDLSFRHRLLRHREDATCATCHDRIDPLGFGLDNFDVLGRWRDSYDGHPVVASGMLPDGTEYSGPKGLKQALLERRDQFTRNLTKKMLGYALGRSLTYEDMCAVDEIVNEVILADYQSHALLVGIVKSIPFRYKGPTTDKP